MSGTASVVVRALGRRVRLHVDASLEEQVRRVWHLCVEDGPGRPDDPGAGVDAEVHHPACPSQEPDARAASLQELTQAVTRAAIGAAAGRSLLLHAGALCHPVTGATLAYVAPGGTGKTTLTRVLGPGRGYVTDETVALTDGLDLEPYPKPLSLRRTPWGALKDETAPGELGLAAAAVHPWLAGVVVLRRDAGEGAAPEVVDVPLLDALVALAPETSSLARLERPLHRLAEALEATGGLRRVHFHEAADLEPLVAEVLGRWR